MKGKSYIQAELNLVLHVAAPVSFFDFVDLGGVSYQSSDSESQLSYQAQQPEPLVSHE